MKQRLTIYTVYILLTGLFGFLPTVNAAPGDLDSSFSLDGKATDGVGSSRSNLGNATAIQADGKIIVAGDVDYGNRKVCGIARYNTDGSLDTSFDYDGKAFVTIGSHLFCNAVAVQADGKIVAAGYSLIGTTEYDFAVVRLNANGLPDPTFDGDGKVTTDIGGSDTARGVIIQPDGKIVVAGYNVGGGFRFALVRYNPNGSLDTGFDGDGKVTTSITGDDVAQAVALQADGKIVAAGYSTSNSDGDFSLARYNTDGSLDTSFDGDGKVTTPVLISDGIDAVAIQADGKIVAAGTSYSGTDNDFALVRYNTDGSLDTSFDGDGKTTTSILNSQDYVTGAAIQTDGKIIVAGTSDNGSDFEFSLARYNPNGSPDTSFSGDGKVTTQIGKNEDSADGVVIQPDGKIVAAGFSGDFTIDDFAVARYNPDGSLDTSFDGDGITVNKIGFLISVARAVAIQADGKMVVAGKSSNGANDDISLVRYNADGLLDTTFGTGGRVITPIFNDADAANAVAIQPDGKIVAAGSANGINGDDFAFVRYTPDGIVDNSFGAGGKVTVWIGNAADIANAVAIQPDGKIVAAGYSYGGTANQNDFALVRLNPNGSLDTSFDGDGKVTTHFTFSDYANAVAIQPDGKIVAAGYSAVSNDDFLLVRYNPNGSLDTSFDGDGKVSSTFGFVERANAVAIQPDGKIVAAGYAAPASFTSIDFALIRYNPNGSLDTSFDGDGKVTTPIGNLNEYANAVAIQSDGRIVAAGYTQNGTDNDFALVRYNANGSLDNSYSSDGKVTFDMLGASNDIGYGMALDSTGKAVVAGTTNGLFAVARVLSDFASLNAPFDFDGDNKTDISIFRPPVGEWWYLKSSDGGNAAFRFGASSDKLAPGDFTGDGKTDVAIWRPSTGEWFILRSEDSSYYSFPFGIKGDIPAPADFDSDGKTDAAVFRPSNSTWFINKSSGGTTIQQFGTNGDVPAAADYDGDGKSDIAIWRASAGEWWINRSAAGTIAFTFGNSADKPVQGDFTGDGKADAAIWRPSTGEWFILRSEDFSYYSFPFGTVDDIPSPGDYDGDGRFDAAVFRPSSSTWYVQRTTAGTLIQSFGQSGDRPVPNVFVP